MAVEDFDDPTAQLTPHNIVMQQAHDMNRNLFSLPPLHNPNGSYMENALRAVMVGLSALAPGSRFPHVQARNAHYAPRDSIPTVAGGRPNAPFGSNDIAANNFGMRTTDHVNTLPGQNLAPANLNAVPGVTTNPPIPQAVVDSIAGRYQSGFRDRFSTIPGGREHPNPTVNSITNWLVDANVPISQIQNRGGTHYIIGLDNAGQPVTIRVPADGHAGRGPRGREVGNRFDLGDRLPSSSERPPTPGHVVDPRSTANVSGQPYSNPDNLFAALQARFSAAPGGRNWLTPPDVAPIFRQPNFGSREVPPLPENTQGRQLTLDFDTKGGPGSGRRRQTPPAQTTTSGTVYNGPPLENIIAPNQAVFNTRTVQRIEGNRPDIREHLRALNYISNAEMAARIRAMTGEYLSPGQVLAYRRSVLGHK